MGKSLVGVALPAMIVGKWVGLSWVKTRSGYCVG